VSDKLQLILDSDSLRRFTEYCRSDRTAEMCGLFVIREGIIDFVPCKNSAYDPRNSFLIHPVDFVACMDTGDVIGVGHSHVTAPARPSPEDIINSENCKLPFVIYQPETDMVDSYAPTGQPMKLIGRQWHLGVSDCYSLVRDYYKTQGVELNDYVRNDRECLFKDTRFLDLFEENGFVDVTGEPPKIHDLALIQVLADIPNHSAVFVSENIILHHLQGRLSCRDPYGGYWKRHTNKLLRHKTWL
jgi:proteasome lid subunit RPN8/RPN11